MWKGFHNPELGELLTMVINHVLIGMIPKTVDIWWIQKSLTTVGFPGVKHLLFYN